jgi:hypothetical protein
VSKRRVAAAVAVIAGIASPAAALAASGSQNSHDNHRGTTHVRKIAVLRGPTRRLQRTINVEVPKIRAAQRRKQQAKQQAAYSQLPGGVSLDTLNAIAACESGGDPTSVSSDGTYRGKYQFDYGTWASVGGSGDPAAAPEAEQDYRAALLYSQSGTSPWPVCGQ